MTNKNLSLLLERIEGKDSLSDRFHKSTNNTSLFLHSSVKEMPESWLKIHFKTYPRLERVELKKPKNTSFLAGIMRTRRSIRKFDGRPISNSDLSYILYSPAGIIYPNEQINNTRRPYPSAGARYPLEIYPLVLNGREIEKGLYHYNVLEHSLEIIFKQEMSTTLSRLMGGEKWPINACVVFIITGVLDRTRTKYKDRGYRYILLEAGHLAQNIMLISEELHMGSCAIGGYIDNEVNKLLDIQHTKEVALYLIVVGKYDSNQSLLNR